MQAADLRQLIPAIPWRDRANFQLLALDRSLRGELISGGL